MSKKQPSTLAYIQEMFKDKVDDDVIKLVFTECQYNGMCGRSHIL